MNKKIANNEVNEIRKQSLRKFLTSLTSVKYFVKYIKIFIQHENVTTEQFKLATFYSRMMKFSDFFMEIKVFHVKYSKITNNEGNVNFL